MSLTIKEEVDRMGILDNIKNWIIDDEDPETDDKETGDKGQSEFQKDFRKEVNIEDLDALILIAKPKTFKDAQKLCDQIKRGRAVMLNLSGLVPEEKQRLIDFVSGVVMAQDGLIGKVYDNVYVCASKNIGIISFK